MSHVTHLRRGDFGSFADRSADYAPRFRRHARHVGRDNDVFSLRRRDRADLASLQVDGQALSASFASASLKASSRTITRQDDSAGSTTVIQRDRLDLRLSATQVAVENGNVEGIASALEDQPAALARVFDAAGLLGDFSSQLSDEFLGRIRLGLEGLADDGGQQFQASRLDLNISVRTKSVQVTNEDGSIIERSVQRIDVRVRFAALSVSGEVGDAQEPIAANIEGGQAQLAGLGPLQQFDFNGDGQFTFDDIVALADQVIPSEPA